MSVCVLGALGRAVCMCVLGNWEGLCVCICVLEALGRCVRVCWEHWEGLRIDVSSILVLSVVVESLSGH